MSLRYFKILRDSSPKGNCIPSGRQLPRTPPLSDVKRHLDFGNEDSDVVCEESQHHNEADTRDQDDHEQNRTFEFDTRETKTENVAEPGISSSMLKGMKGYQLTAGDLEFINRMREEKLIKKYQGDLEEVQRLLKKETMALQLAHALKEAAQVELSTFPSCEELTEWVKVVLRMTSPATEITGLDPKSLLAMVTRENVQRTMDMKRAQLARLEKMVANKRKKEAEDRGLCEKQIANEQVKIQGLMSHLSDLTYELAQQEEAFKALQMQIKAQEEGEAADPSEEQQTGKSQKKPQGKQRKKAVGSAEKLLDTTKQSKQTRSKRTHSKTDNEKHVKDDQANKSTRETSKSSTEEQAQQTKAAAERPTRLVKTARVPQKKVCEQESSSQETLQAVRGRKKPPETTKSKASQPKNQCEIKTGEARPTSQQAAPSRSSKKRTLAADHAAEGAQSVGLRRSRRIASRR
ncbi:hypothetical protein Q8A73_004233 [Channa argus]|nr:hypothetical protein Q8A73_004233 [Channa argus]